MKRLATCLCLWASTAAAQSVEDIARLDVLPGWRTDEGHQMAGLQITLAPGWKTYWRAPGDAGIPPQIRFDGSENVESARFLWPVPEVFDQNGMRSIGYHDSVVIPLEVASRDDGPMRLTGEIEIGVCEEICVPVTLAFDTVLPTDGRRDPAIVAALVNRPMTAAEASAGPATCTVSPSNSGLSVTVSIDVPHTGGAEVVVIETSDPMIWVSEADVTRSGATIMATSDLVHLHQDSFAVDRVGLRFTVLGQDRAVDIRGCSAG